MSKLTHAEESAQVRESALQQLKNEFGMTEKQAQEYYEALMHICDAAINDVLREKRARLKLA